MRLAAVALVVSVAEIERMRLRVPEVKVMLKSAPAAGEAV
jgi:hypothetical protein